MRYINSPFTYLLTYLLTQRINIVYSRHGRKLTVRGRWCRSSKRVRGISSVCTPYCTAYGACT